MKKLETGRLITSQRVVRRRSLLSIALLIALSLVPSSRAKAQVECLGNCEARFESCVVNLRRTSLLNASCIDTYEACVDACLSHSAALLS